MAATVTTYVYTGAAPGSGAAGAQLRFKNADDNTIDTNNPPVVPGVGTNYSWWKSIALYCSIAPGTSINNVKLYPENFRLFVCSEDANILVAEDIGDLDSLTTFDTIAATQAYAVALNPGYAYVCEYDSNDWWIIDIGNLAALSQTFNGQVQKGTCDPAAIAYEYLTDVVAYSSTYVLLIGTSQCTVQPPANPSINVFVADVSTPASPGVTAFDLTTTFGYAYETAGAVKGTVLYISVFTDSASSACGILSVDLSSLPTVSLLDEVVISGSFSAGHTDIVVLTSDNYAYASHSKGGVGGTGVIRIVNITTPAALSYTDYAITDPWGLANLNDNYLYVCQPSLNQVTVLDISTPTSPSVAGTLTDATNLNNASGIILHPEQNIAFVTCPGDNRVTVLNISDPANPTVRSSVQSLALYQKCYGLGGLSGAAIGWRGCTLYIGDQTTATYVQATGSEDNGDEVVANHSQISSKTNFYTYTRTSPKSVSGSIGAATGRVSNFVVLQPEIGTTGDWGASNLETFYWEYDEI